MFFCILKWRLWSHKYNVSLFYFGNLTANIQLYGEYFYLSSKIFIIIAIVCMLKIEVNWQDKSVASKTQVQAVRERSNWTLKLCFVPFRCKTTKSCCSWRSWALHKLLVVDTYDNYHNLREGCLLDLIAPWMLKHWLRNHSTLIM